MDEKKSLSSKKRVVTGRCGAGAVPVRCRPAATGRILLKLKGNWLMRIAWARQGEAGPERERPKQLDVFAQCENP